MTAPDVQVVFLGDLTQAEEACCCVGEVPTPWSEAVVASRTWLAENAGTLVQGLYLLDEAGKVIGHLHYAFSGQALVAYEIEEGVAVVLCEWIQRQHQGKGYSHILSEALNRRLAAEGCKGILVLATDDEQHMHYRHYARRGFRMLRQDGAVRLMYYPLSQESITVEPLKRRIRAERRYPVEVLAFIGGLCPYEVTTPLLAVEVAREFGQRVIVKEVLASREALHEYGTAEGVWINGRRLPGGGLPEEAIRLAIIEALESR